MPLSKLVAQAMVRSELKTKLTLKIFLQIVHARLMRYSFVLESQENAPIKFECYVNIPCIVVVATKRLKSAEYLP
jgi:hypothetical protein